MALRALSCSGVSVCVWRRAMGGGGRVCVYSHVRYIDKQHMQAWDMLKARSRQCMCGVWWGWGRGGGCTGLMPTKEVGYG